MNKKGEINKDALLGWLITLLVIALVIFAFYKLFWKGSDALAFVKSLIGRA